MKKVLRNNQGFSILEVVVVLAVLGALAAMLSPVVFRYVEDANRARAQQDTRTIATAIQQAYSDTGRWPFYKTGNGATAYTSGTDAALLFTSSNACASNAVVTANAEAPTATGAGWNLATAKCDTLTNQLIANSPFSGNGGVAYLTTGARRWQGPYTETLPAFDAWNKSYVVNIGDAGANTDAVLVISSGPDGILQTSADQALTSNAGALSTSDDIVTRVK